MYVCNTNNEPEAVPKSSKSFTRKNRGGGGKKTGLLPYSNSGVSEEEDGEDGRSLVFFEVDPLNIENKKVNHLLDGALHDRILF